MNASARSPGALPLSALLSQAWVAFTVEFDNEFEHRTPHRTTNYGSTGSGAAPWLVSMPMWMIFLRFVPDHGISIREFQRLVALTNKETKSWLTRLSQWWGYVAIDKNGAQAPLDCIIRPTSGGRKALQVWRPLTAIIEKRWQERLGNGTIGALCESMQSLVSQFRSELPDCLPILGYEMLSKGSDLQQRDEGTSPSARERTLPALLSKVLLAFAIEYERESRLSLAISANVLRLATEEGIRVRDLPRLSGVSKEAIAMAVKRLEERGFGIVQTLDRVKTLVLTAQGRQARNTYDQLTRDIEKRWKARFGQPAVHLRQTIECLSGESSVGQSPLLAGLEPYPDGWRASVPRREVLPHYPMVLHRGGFPDGS